MNKASNGNFFVRLTSPEETLSRGEQQSCVEKHFHEAVVESPFHLWKPGDPVKSDGERLLIGVATYSKYDMDVLEQLRLSMLGETGNKLWVDVFSYLDCRTAEDLRHHIPSILKAFTTGSVEIPG